MARPHDTLWLQTAPADPASPADLPAGCGGCAPSGAALSCQLPLAGPACAAPLLDGPAEPLQRVMDALSAVLDPDAGRSIVDLQWVEALRIAGGEAELTLTFPLRCGSARLLADGAFQALRHALPDTDVYVRHAAV